MLATASARPAPTPTATVMPKPTHPRVSTAPSEGYLTRANAVLWVDELVFAQLERAHENRDDGAYHQIFYLYEHFEIPPGTLVKLVRYDPKTGLMQLHICSGKYVTKRGWTTHPRATDLEPEA